MILKPRLIITAMISIAIIFMIYYPVSILSDSNRYSPLVGTSSKISEKKDDNTVKGIYALMKVNGEINPLVLSLPYIEGISLRVRWSKLEPEYRKYEWEYIDKILEHVRGTGKEVMIRVLPGVSSPSWIYKEGAAKVEFAPHREKKRIKFGNQVTTPLMWDKKYLSLWNEFNDALSKRYSGNSSIVMVHMSGPTVYSAEMHLLKSKEGKKLLGDAGYSRDKVVNAWIAVIDNYSKKFQGIKLSLNIALPLKKDGTLEEILNYAASKLGTRLSVQGNWLKAKTASGFLPYRLMSDLNETNKEVEIGFQMAWSSKNNSANQGALEDAVKKGTDINAKYFEIYQADLLDAGNKEYLLKLNNKLVSSN